MFEAADGRCIYARLAGPEDGETLFFHTGTPGSRHLWEEHVSEGAKRGLRHICCSRPGYEGSDRQQGRRFADCVADISVVADALGVDRFYVVGVSVGANFALACAALLPEQVISAAAMAAFAPRAAAGLSWRAGMSEQNLREFAALEAGPARLEQYITRQIAEYGSITTAKQLAAGMEGFFSEPDAEVSTGSFLEFQLEDCLRLGRDGIWGWYDDDWAIWEDWGFDLAQIEVPVSIWHGGKDKFIPLAHGEWLAANVPGARAHLLPDEGHMSLWVRHYGAVLDELLGVGRLAGCG